MEWSDAINKGLKLATGYWVLILGADDRLLENGISTMFNEENNINNAYYGNVINKKNGSTWGGRYKKYLIMYYKHPASSYSLSARYYKLNKYNLTYQIALYHAYLIKYMGCFYDPLSYTI